jgi:hypothetical protein
VSSRISLVLLASVFTAACATRPAPTPVAVDPALDPTIIGAVSVAAGDGAEAAARASSEATTGRRIGIAVGLVSAIFGGENYEPIGRSIDRYRRIRDDGEAIGASVAASKAAKSGWQRGLTFDTQMVDLQKIDGLTVTRPTPMQLDVRLFDATIQPLHEIAAAISDRDHRTIVIEGAPARTAAVREGLVANGLPDWAIETSRNDDIGYVVLHIRYRN